MMAALTFYSCPQSTREASISCITILSPSTPTVASQMLATNGSLVRRADEAIPCAGLMFRFCTIQVFIVVPIPPFNHVLPLKYLHLKLTTSNIHSL